MDKNKLTNLGRFTYRCYIPDFYIPLNEYVIFSPTENLKVSGVYLYRYVENELYATRYQRLSFKTRDTIVLNIKNGNTYEQFLPLTRIENIDSMVNMNSHEMFVKMMDSISKNSKKDTTVNWDEYRQDSIVKQLMESMDRTHDPEKLDSLLKESSKREELYRRRK
jgi:hypothetical protein